MRARQRPTGSDALASFADKSAAAKAEQRERDLYALSQLLDSDELRPDEEDAFSDMKDGLEQKWQALTDKQRKWVLSRCEELGIDADPSPHEERNKNVPRGREVQTPAVLQALPKAPPGRGSGYSSGALQLLDQDRRAATFDALSVRKAKSQLERARDLANEACFFNESRVEELKNLLEVSQNRPPLGAADGSFSDEQWTALRDLLRAVQDVERHVGTLMGRTVEPEQEEDDIPF